MLLLEGTKENDSFYSSSSVPLFFSHTHHLLVLIVDDVVSKVGTFVDGARGILVVGTASTGMDEKLESM